MFCTSFIMIPGMIPKWWSHDHNESLALSSLRHWEPQILWNRWVSTQAGPSCFGLTSLRILLKEIPLTLLLPSKPKAPTGLVAVPAQAVTPQCCSLSPCVTGPGGHPAQPPGQQTNTNSAQAGPAAQPSPPHPSPVQLSPAPLGSARPSPAQTCLPQSEPAEPCLA